MTRIVLGFVVLFGESTIVAELAYFSWPSYSTWVMGLVLCSVTVADTSAIILRVLAGKSDVREFGNRSTLSRLLIDFSDP